MNRRMLALHAVVMIVIWVQAIYKVWEAEGALHLAGHRLRDVLDRGEPRPDRQAVGSLRPGHLCRAMAPYAEYYRRPAPTAGPVPHHAVTFLTYAPFARFRPIPGYSLWLLANALLATLVMRRLDQRFSEPSWGAPS